MSIDIGKQIKALRMEKGITQEEVAFYLQISCQAVSKWENGTTAPDIGLLPKISVYFGVTIDELFKLPQGEQLERIDNMLMNERVIDKQTFEGSEKYLLDLLELEEKNVKALELLAGLYNHRAKCDHERARNYAKRGLAYEPTIRNLHVNLVEALEGITGDGYYDNNRELIKYYKNFIKINPDYDKAYSILIENLIADRRFTEAEEYIEKARLVKDRYCYYVFEGDIEFGKGSKEKALEIWYQVVKDYPKIWQAYCCLADRLLSLGEIEEAIKYYRLSYEVQDKPRICDGLISLAQIYEDRKENHKAIAMWQEIIEFYKEDYNIISGELIDEPKRNIARLATH